ncbi:DNA-3-methyladenine glycosylase 2 [Gemmata obscuriglobus]|uniref:DNA-3-methyladenine glycosylase II n=1 Tax=Gemmata obscuriglobus TaxID=114 RepID=A0A2Z3HDK4_9BACT|nr:DNA-3-methyladenine glycosylase [Gemmata obscuriglobus]AWM41045.1 DNA-3-methyladenine glycosylase 2 family protein [Gemmata obscuriglobus]QEG25632.1 DNA-3-methyladenine glycosylase 2 [Gemmata obscuriglobus]VTR99165.1 dna-3-methyladenine glycosylase ii : HhH-GPD superfamily base excision DNA repair protein OS=Candidatus Nitrososphaera evergladensis SR1 GN=NTE_03049 PE=4 SV=1: HhH-GPD [Gemmata obscuriglobus UQM 2246]
MSTPFYQQAREHLSAACPVMNGLIGRVGPCLLMPRGEDPFTLLVRCVIGQQISTKAAESIYNRLARAVNPPPEGPHPADGTSLAMWQREGIMPMDKLAALSEAEFKECGVSGPKQRTLRAVVEHARANPDLLPSIAGLDDDTIRERLTVIKGIGPWTVDMYLLFGLGRPDVLSVGDYGIKVAVKNLFRLRKLPDPAKLTRVAKPWQPYRSVALWYLWRSLDKAHQGE